jgi:hypothetical protein
MIDVMKIFRWCLASFTVFVLIWYAVYRDGFSAVMLAGGVTGMIECFLTYPLVNITVQRQLEPMLSYRTAVKSTISKFGFSGFYAGVTPLLLAAMPTQALRWGTYEMCCRSLGCNTVLQALIAGVLTGAVVATLTGIPVETLKLHAISRQGTMELPMVMSPLGVADADPEPKGWIPTVAKKIASQATRFPLHHMVYEQICVRVVCEGASLILSNFCAGLCAGIGVVAVTHPIDVLKSRMQGRDSHRYRNSVHCLVSLLREGGPRVLFRGIRLRALRTCLGTGITFMLVPVVKQFLLPP